MRPVRAPPAATIAGMPDQFACDLTTLTAADDGVRPMPPKWIVVHTNEGPKTGTVEGLLGYLANTANQASYHIVVGADGRTGRSNDDDYAPWAAGYTANRGGLHVCAIGYSKQSRAEWLASPKQLDGLARVIADWSTRYSIPLTRIVAADLVAGRKGVCGHFDTAQAWHETDHVDPGTQFPWDVVLAKAAVLNAPTQKENPVPRTDSQRIKEIREQLVGFDKTGAEKFVGWSQLGDHTVPDAVALLGVVIRRMAAAQGVDASELNGFKKPL